MKIRIMRLLEDNYSYILFPNRISAWLVDPAICADVLSELNYHLYEVQEQKNNYIPITNVLITHRHYDHCGQTGKLLEVLNEENKRNGYLKQIQVFMGYEDYISGDFEWVNIPVTQQTQEFEVDGITIRTIKVPCHTKGHLLYYVYDNKMLADELQDIKNDVMSGFDQNYDQDKDYSQVLFTGDTMFSSGCGRFFEGSAQDMQSNFDKLNSLPVETYVFCGHEYTINDINWTLKVDPDNQVLKKKQEWAIERRKQQQETMPTTIRIEKFTNLFMRTRQKELQQRLGVDNEEQCMSKLREMKNHNRGLL